MILCISVLSVVISPFSFLILLILFFSLCFLMSLANGPKQDKPKAKHPKTHINQINIVQTQRTNIKAARKKQQITHKGIPIKITADLSIETLQARRECQDILKVMKENNLSPDYCTQQGSHSNMKEKSKASQTSKSWENSAPPNQLSNKCSRIFSRQETQKGCINSNPKQ